MISSDTTFFLVAGAGKSGTSALADVMERDPDISFARIKEPRFFIHQTGFRNHGSTLGPPNDGTWQRGVEYYSDLFDIKEGTAAFGEASTGYFYCHESPELIARFRPDTRLIFVLRDPVARIMSQYRHEIKVGRRLPSLAAILQEDGPTLARYVWGSRYATHLERYLRWFSPEQILVLEYDEFFSDSAAGYQRIRRFLELPTRSNTEFNFNRVNEAREPVSRFLTSAVRGASRVGLGGRLPPWLRERGHRLRNWLHRATTRPARAVPIEPVVENILCKCLADEIDRLEVLLGAEPALLKGGQFNLGRWRAVDKTGALQVGASD